MLKTCLLTLGAVFSLQSINAMAGTSPGRASEIALTAEPLSTQIVGYHIGSGYPGNGYLEGDTELAEWAFKAWERAAGGGLRLVRTDETNARIRLYWVGPRAGFYGQAKPNADGRNGTTLLIRTSVRGLGPGIKAPVEQDRLFRDTIVYLTCLHEIGHALGLVHTADERDIMYWFGYGGDIPGFFRRYRDQLRERGDIPAVAGLSQRDVERLRARFPARP